MRPKKGRLDSLCEEVVHFTKQANFPRAELSAIVLRDTLEEDLGPDGPTDSESEQVRSCAVEAWNQLRGFEGESIDSLRAVLKELEPDLLEVQTSKGTSKKRVQWADEKGGNLVIPDDASDPASSAWDPFIGGDSSRMLMEPPPHSVQSFGSLASMLMRPHYHSAQSSGSVTSTGNLSMYSSISDSGITRG
jgi:hypothetical protein